MTDSRATVDELKNSVKQFCEQRNWDQFHNPKDLAIGVCTESAELLQIFRFKTNEQCLSMLDHAETRRLIGEELADILYFVLRFSQMYGYDLSDELERKIRKNALRYPVEKSYGSNAKYDEMT